MRYLVPLSIVLAALLAPFAFSHPTVVQAQTESAGCAAYNDPSYDGFYAFNSSGVLPFKAGERLTFSAGEPSDLGPVGVYLSKYISNVVTLIDDDDYPGSVSYIFPSDQDARFFWAVAGISGVSFATWQVSCTPAPSVPVTIDIPFRYDGRLCYWDNYAVYTTGEKIDVYGIADRRGFPVLNVTQAELDAVPGAEGVNTLVKATEDGKVQVYRLGTSNTYQVHAGMDFVTFTGLPAANKRCGTITLP